MMGSVDAAYEADGAVGTVAVNGAAGSTGAGAATALQTGRAPRGGSWWYDVYGLNIRSDVRLPLGDAGARVNAADVEYVLRGDADGAPAPSGQIVASQPCGLHGFDMLVHRGAAGETWIWHRAIATCHVLPGARRVDVYPEPGVDEDVLGLLLIGQVAVFVLHQLGTPTLHASATLTERGGVAFLGPKGQGKSTMVAAFLKRGATLLTDDVLPLRIDGTGVYGSPSLPIMKLWQQTVESTLELGDELPCLMANYDKKLLRVEGRYEFAAAPVRLRAFYVLHRYGGAGGSTTISSRALAGSEAIAALRSQLSPGAFPTLAEEARLLPVYARLVRQAPVYVLSFPDGFDHQAAVYEYVMAELGRLGEQDGWETGGAGAAAAAAAAAARTSAP